MAVYNIFSKRDQMGKEPEIYNYDNLPSKLRIQIHHIIKDTIGKDREYYYREVKDIYITIRKILKKEYGVFYLGFDEDNAEEDVLNLLLHSSDVKQALDVVELCFKIISTYIKGKFHYTDMVLTEMEPDEAIDELNKRFKENAVGYTFESDRIIRIDSTYTHSAITKPTLKLLSNKVFQNANEEYLKAHDHYRHGRNKECLTECLKAFESVMKIICSKKGWQHNENDTSSKLIRVCFDNNLIPQYLQTQFTSLKAVLESGIPTIRNKVGGHGQGIEKKDADDQLVRYALNLTGSNIILLVEQSELLK